MRCTILCDGSFRNPESGRVAWAPGEAEADVEVAPDLSGGVVVDYCMMSGQRIVGVGRSGA